MSDRRWHRHLFNVPISRIRLHDWPNQMRPGTVEFLIKDIRTRGLDSPVDLVLTDEGFFAVNGGRHRITAFKGMRRYVIAAWVGFAEDQERQLYQLLGRVRQPSRPRLSCWCPACDEWSQPLLHLSSRAFS
jgi:hypothetical protein